jgi:hypothetical protein
MKLISMTKFVLETNELTRAEIWKEYLNSDIKYLHRPLFGMSSGLAEVKQDSCVQYAKFLSKKITVQLLTNELCFELLESKDKDMEFINSGYCIICTGSGFWLSSYDAAEGREVKTVEDLVGLDINVDFKIQVA